MKLTARSLSTSSSMIFYLSEVKGLFFCLTNLILGSIFNWWVITFRRISSISAADQAKILAFAPSRFTSCYRFGSDNYDPIWIVFSGSSSFNGIEISCSTGSSISSFFLWSNLSTDKESSDWLFFVETMKQRRASCWSSYISPTLILVKNRINKWYIETTALKALNLDRPNMAL